MTDKIFKPEDEWEMMGAPVDNADYLRNLINDAHEAAGSGYAVMPLQIKEAVVSSQVALRFLKDSEWKVVYPFLRLAALAEKPWRLTVKSINDVKYRRVAEITVDWHGEEISFLDVDYAFNFDLYEVGKAYDFYLGAVVHEVGEGLSSIKAKAASDRIVEGMIQKIKPAARKDFSLNHILLERAGGMVLDLFATHKFLCPEGAHLTARVSLQGRLVKGNNPYDEKSTLKEADMIDSLG